MAAYPLRATADELAETYQKVRQLSLDIAEPLSDAEATLQPMPDSSPAKWHLGHCSWFFETFVLRDHLPGYVCSEGKAYLFNSYYDGEGARLPRDKRGMLARPSLDEVRDYRRRVDDALLAALPALPEAARWLVEVGVNHEQQHQELMLMDLLAAFAEQPSAPSMWQRPPDLPASIPAMFGWLEGPSGLIEIGHSGPGFAFDCEGPRHSHFLHPHKLADRLVTNADYIEFIEDNAYSDPLLWLAEGWAWIRSAQISAPLYWRRDDEGWSRFGLDGRRTLNLAEPVCHISYYEADAFARWAGARLPTEFEWEASAVAADPGGGNQLDQAGAPRPTGAGGWFGDCWCWTASAFLPYPGFTPAAGVVGEYNGKFMCSQMVLRGGSCATPRGHLRASYRNFYYPHQRWMFSGIRLARDN